MVLKYITKGGSRIHGPPYTKTEQADLYRRTAGGPVTLARADDKTTSLRHQPLFLRPESIIETYFAGLKTLL